jgi:hypothetical protein
MAKNSKTSGQAPALKGQKWTVPQIARAVVGVLVLVNLALAFLVMNPPGGSAEALEEDMGRLQAQIKQAKVRADEVKKHADAVTKGRGQADEFLNRYFVARRTAPTALISELNHIAQKAGIKDRGNAFSPEMIDGSDTLGMVTITWNFEGSYKNLLAFVREIDRSNSLLIIDSLNAAPQAGSNQLLVSMKLNAFIREDGSIAPAETAVAQAGAQAQEVRQ